MKLQDYAPYRASLLPPETLKRLYRLNPARAVRDTLTDWACILAAWTVAYLHPVWWVVLPVVLFVGSRYYSLIIIAHDGLHRRLFDTVKANDLWNDLFILGPIGTITRLNRLNHMRHHRELALPSDPDRFKYAREGRDSRLRFALTLTCVPLLVTAVGNVLVPKPAPVVETSGGAAGENIQAAELGHYTPRDLAIIGGWMTVLAGGLTAAFGWWGWPLLWAAPVAIGLCCDILRVFCEHSQLTDDAAADQSLRLVSYDCNLVERVVFAPNNMNHHIAHHLWPAIPYYNLPEAERLIRHGVGGDSALAWRPSYFGHIAAFWRSLGRR